MFRNKNSIGVLCLAIIVSLLSFSLQAGETTLSSGMVEKVKKQLNYLLSKTYQKGEEELKTKGSMNPYGAVFKPDGTDQIITMTNKKIIPADYSIKILRRSLSALAHKGKIAASLIYYVTPPMDEHDKKDKNKFIMVVEMEHSQGIGFMNLTPFKITNHKLVYGKSKQIEMKMLSVMNGMGADASK